MIKIMIGDEVYKVRVADFKRLKSAHGKKECDPAEYYRAIDNITSNYEPTEIIRCRYE